MTSPAARRPEQASPAYVPGHGLLGDKVVVVTAGAGAGIGAALVRRVLEEGARAVVVSDTHERRLAEAKRELSAEFGHDRVATVRCDVTDEGQVSALLAAAEPFGGVDVMVNNAGLGGTAGILEMTDEQWSRVLDVTLTGTFRMTREVLGHMVGRGSGVIVNNASVIGWRAQAGQAHYAAAKAGVMALTRCSALDLAPHGIRVNCLCPVMGETGMLDDFIGGDSPEKRAKVLAGIPLGRLSRPLDIANAALFLASDEAAWITGANLAVNGGQYMGW